jgi:hypothetical protein
VLAARRFVFFDVNLKAKRSSFVLLRLEVRSGLLIVACRAAALAKAGLQIHAQGIR